MLRIPSHHFYSTKQMFQLLEIFTYAFNVGSNAEMCLTQVVFSVQLLHISACKLRCGLPLQVENLCSEKQLMIH